MSAVQEIAFAGETWGGSVEFDLEGLHVGVDVFSVPADPESEPHMTVARIVATPDQADALSLAFAEWAALARARQHANSVPPLLALLARQA